MPVDNDYLRAVQQMSQDYLTQREAAQKTERRKTWRRDNWVSLLALIVAILSLVWNIIHDLLL